MQLKGLVNMERKMDFWTIEVPTKFEDKKQLERLQKALYDKFQAIKGKHKDYMIQAVLGISHTNWHYVKGVYNKKIGGSGRSIKEKDLIEETDITKVTFGNLYTKWHLHILVLSSPSETLAKEIKSYIDKNWDVAVSYRKFKNGKGYDIDIGMLFYIAEQSESESIMFVGSNDKRFDYTFRNMYSEMVKKYTRLKFDKKYLVNEEYRNKADTKYYDMLKYFDTFYSEELRQKKVKEYKAKARQRIIREKYENISSKDNKVLKKRSITKKEYDSIIKV